MQDPTDVTTIAPAGSISDRTRAYLARSKAPATVRAYRADLRDFEAWCVGQGRECLPAAPETVADYISALAVAGRSAATITRRLSAISQAHQMGGLDTPTQAPLVRMTAAGIRRTVGTAPHSARPILVAELRAMLEALPDDVRGRRDRALLLVGFAGGLRRSELVALNVEDLQFNASRGLLIVIRGSKTDQERAGTRVAVPWPRGPRICFSRARRNTAPRWMPAACSQLSGRCAAATRSPIGGSQTSRPR